MDEYNGIFPDNYKDILGLKGVGPYTAAAIGSFAFDLSYVVVDGNVLRFMSRLLAIDQPIDSTSTKKLIATHAQELLDYAEPAEFNQAIMEIGALVCTPKKPNCNKCPVSKQCVALKKKMVDKLPYKEKKISKRSRFFYFYYIIDSDGKTLIEKRNDNDIWKGLYQFPLQEVDSFEKEDDAIDFMDLEKYGISGVYRSVIKKQLLTHQKIHAIFHKIELTKPIKTGDYENYIVIPVENLNKYPLPKIMDLYFNDLSITLF